MDNDVDEQVLVNLMPMLVEGAAAHARAVEAMILNGNGTIAGYSDVKFIAHTEILVTLAHLAKLTSAISLNARQLMASMV